MKKNSTTDTAPLFVGEAWFDPIEPALELALAADTAPGSRWASEA
jgi:hypothetical protein